MQDKTKLIEQGAKGEKLFSEWLDKEEIAYLHINQAQDFYSSIFKDSIKRPDFLVLLPSLGFIAVDVKHYTPNGSGAFTLNIPNEISKSATFEHLTRLYLWYAYKNCENKADDWHFISAHRAMEKGKKEVNRGTKEDYLVIEPDHFKLIQKQDDFKKLFNARLGSVGIISRSIEHYFCAMS